MAEPLQMVEELKVYIKNRDFYALNKLIEEAQPPGEEEGDLPPGSLSRRELLLEELEIQVDDLKTETVRRFDNEEFNYCLETFEFLSRVNPNDRTLKDYLELCKQFATERTAEPPADLSGWEAAARDVTPYKNIEQCHEAEVESVGFGTISSESGPTELELCKQFATEQTAEPPADLSGQEAAARDVTPYENIEQCHE